MQNANGNSQPVHFPALYLEPSISTTKVVTTTTTTTTYAPIPIPAVPSTSSPPKDGKEYPLYNVRLPPSVREFNLDFPGGKRALFRAQNSGNEGDAESSGTSNTNFATEELASGRGWRMLPREDSQSASNTVPVVGINEALEGYSTKKRERGHEYDFESIAMEDTPARKKARAPPSPLPSPHGSPPPGPKPVLGWHPISSNSDSTSNQSQITQTPTPTPQTPFEPDLSMTTLLTLPTLMNHFTSLPEQLQSHVLLMLLRQSPLPVLRTLHSVLHPTLARDFLTLLPPELVSHILGFFTLSSLGRACRVCKAWRGRIEQDKVLWRDFLIRAGLWFGGESEANFVKMLMRKRRMAIIGPGTLPLAHPYKILFKSRYLTYTRWINNPSPKHISFAAHGRSVVTCLLFSQNRIISASDDHSIHVYSPTTGRLLLSLDGHEGGVWALAAHENLLVSGSTDRTVRIWDLEQGRCLHVFGGHTSTVRCLAIVKPELITNPETGNREKWPKRTMIVTGSRDHTLRVWKLPKRGEKEFDSRIPPSPSSRLSRLHPPSSPDVSDAPDPLLNPYHVHLLSGHAHAVRALAARGRTLVSGSYDFTVRVWDIPSGRLVHTLNGHTQKVYSVVLDSRDGTWGSEGWGYGQSEYGGGTDARAASGSMDGTVRLWSIATGECLHILSGHTSLVGLLGLSPSFMVSAAADSTLRVWDARLPASSSNDSKRNRTAAATATPGASSSNSNDLLRGVMTGHTGAITCFQHDEWKVVSGSDGTLKVWDLRDINAANHPSSSVYGSSLQGGGVGAGGWAHGPVPGFGMGAGAGFGGGVVPATAGGTGGPVPVLRDLLTGITGVWQVAFEGRWCVSASNRNDVTVLDVWDFGKVSTGTFDPSGSGVSGPPGSGLTEVDEETRERDMKGHEGWTWEDEEWVGEPPNGVYDYEDSELEDSDVDETEGFDFGGDRDDDGDIEVTSVQDRDEDDDIVYTGRRSASASSGRETEVGSSSGSHASQTVLSSAPRSRKTGSSSNASRGIVQTATSRTRRTTRAMSEMSRASDRSTRSRGSSGRMDVDNEIDIDIEVLSEVPEESSRGIEGHEIEREGYGDVVEEEQEGDDRDAEIVEDMMEVDREFVDSKRPSTRRQATSTNEQWSTATVSASEASTSRHRPSGSTTSTRAVRNGTNNLTTTTSRRHAPSVASTRASTGLYVGRRGQGPSTSHSRAADVTEMESTSGATSGSDVLGDDGEVRMSSPGVGVGGANGRANSRRRWL